MTKWKYSAKRDAYTKAGYTIISLQEDGYIVRLDGKHLFDSRELLRDVQARCDQHAAENSPY